MLEHREKRTLPYSAQQLFDLVMDIEHYPDFLPWCRATRILEWGKNHATADLSVGYKIYSERFRSNVKFERPKYINVDYLKGPLRNLQNEWHFKEVEKGHCEVDFYVSFSFKSKILEKLATQFFDLALTKMIDAFEKEARKRYD